MKARNPATIGLLVGLLITSGSTTCGAKFLRGDNKTAAPAQAELNTPELAAADEKVAKAKEQWDTARKQLEAAKALLRAAEADYKAAVAAREALALKTKAQGLADASGLNQVAAKPAPENSTAGDGSSRLSAASAPQPAQDLSPTRIQQGDFNAEPVQSETVQLR